MRGVTPGRLVPDPDRPSYRMYLPSPEERRVMVAWAREEIRRAEKADEARVAMILKNRKAYRAKENDKDRVITLPIIKAAVNQQVAGLVNAIMGKDPICTVKPIEAGEIEILLQNEETGQPESVSVTTVDEAEALQLYGEELLRRRIGLRKKIEAAGLDMCRGGMPYFKTTYEANYRTVQHREVRQQIDPETQAVVSTELAVVKEKLPIDEPLRFEVIDGIYVLMPPGETDEQLSPWIAHRWEISPTELRRRFADGRFNFASPATPDPARIDAVANGTRKADFQRNRDDSAEQLGIDVSDRTTNIPVYELWFYWSVEREGEDIETMSLCGQFSDEGGEDAEMLSLYENFYGHGKRPLTPCFQSPDPFEWFSGSTADDLRPIQNAQTAAFHITFKNGIQAITKAYKARLNSIGARSVKEQNRGGGLKPGAVIDVGDMAEIEAFQTGGTMGSLANEMGMLTSLGNQLAVTAEYQNIPNRTPTGTTQAIMAEAKVQGQVVLERMRESLGAAIQMLVQTDQQFSPYGRRVAFRDPVTNAILSRYVGFPVNLIDGQFAFEITASSDEDTKQALREAETINLSMVRESNKSIGEMVFRVLDATTPPFLEAPALKMILREEKQLERVLKLAHKDFRSYSFDEKELNGWLAMKHQYLEEQAREQARAAAEQAKLAAQAPPPAPPQPQMPMPPGGEMPVMPMPEMMQ